MRRIVFAVALCGLLAGSADAGLFKGKFKFRAKEKAAACPCVAQTGSCPCGPDCQCTSAPAADAALRWAGRVVTAPARAAAGVLSCPNGNCRRK